MVRLPSGLWPIKATTWPWPKTSLSLGERGEIPPRWAAGMNGGRGAPTFVVYPPLFAFLTFVWGVVCGSMVDGLRLAVLTTACGLFAATYYLGRTWLPPSRSLAAGVLVALLPGVTLLGVARGMYPNFAALAWIALAGGAAQRIAAGKNIRSSILLLAAGLAGLVLTHALSALMCGVLLALLSPLIVRRLERTAWTRLAAGAALGALLTA